MSDIHERVNQKIKKLPRISPYVDQLIEVLGEGDDVPMDRVIKVVESDPNLTASVLKAVNSAAIGLPRRIDSASQAVSYLGLRAVMSIAFNTGSSEVFESALGGYLCDPGDLWRHSLKTAVLARIISEYSKKSVFPDVAYTAGLLHDIGKSILTDVLEENIGDILKLVRSGGVSEFVVAENELLGVNHASAGALLARAWQLPQLYFEVIARHHYPSSVSTDSRHLAYIVHAADMMAQWSGNGTGVDTLRYRLDDELFDFVNIASPRLERIMVQAEEDFRKTLTALSNR